MGFCLGYILRRRKDASFIKDWFLCGLREPQPDSGFLIDGEMLKHFDSAQCGISDTKCL